MYCRSSVEPSLEYSQSFVPVATSTTNRAFPWTLLVPVSYPPPKMATYFSVPPVTLFICTLPMIGSDQVSAIPVSVKPQR